MYKLIFRTILLIVFLVPVQAWDDITLTASDGAEVIIDRDEFGVPHISGPTEFSVFYAMGFAAAQDRLKQMTINLHSSTGRTMEINQGNLYWDREIRKEYYSLTERQAQFESLQPAVQNMLIAYAEGVNTYYQYMEEEPMLYTPEFIYILQQAGWVIQPWTVYDCIAIHQFYSRNFGQNGGLELLRLSELNNHGWDWFELNRPINNPAAPTTIPDDEAGEALQQGEWHHNDVIFDPNIVTQMQNQDIIMNQIADELNLPEHFGSFAALIDPNKSATSNAMLLGCPQMGAPNLYETNVVNEVELICPDMHVAGMAVAGWPLVIIGHTEDFAWTLTSGFSDNTDTYVDSTQDQTMSNYLYNGEWIPVETIVDTIYDLGSDPYFYTHYRTVHGPVITRDVTNQKLFSHKMTFWQEEHLILESMYDAWHATTIDAFETAISSIKVSFNVFYAGTDQNIKFWHTGKFTDRTEGVDPRLPHIGWLDEEWNGFISFESLPQLANPLQTYFVNWNNKPVYWWNNGDEATWGSTVSWSPWITNRVNNIYNYVDPIVEFTYNNLKDIPVNIDSHGTYQQAIEFAPNAIIDENIVPPGQNEFVDLTGILGPNCNDQWPLHDRWDFKDQIFADSDILAGDVNFDYEVDVNDIVLMVGIAMGFHTPTPEEFSAADLNGDSLVDVLDIVIVVGIILE